MENKSKIGCLLIIVGIAIIIFFNYLTEQQASEKEEVEVLYTPPTETTIIYEETPKQKTQYRKTTPLTPKQKREIAEESQYEWDVREEAEEEMDERGINEDF